MEYGLSMWGPAVYRDAYGLRPRTLRAGWPVVYGVRGVLGGWQFSTDPYATDTRFPDAVDGWADFLDAARALVSETKAHHLLLKLRPGPLVDALPADVRVSSAFSKTVLDLRGGREEVWMRRVSSRTRNKVRNGQKVGVAFEIDRHALLDPFYEVIVRTQTDLGTPVHARRFFGAILDHHDDTRLLVGFVDGRPVSAAMIVIRDGRILHPYTGTLAALKKKRVNHALYWRIAELGLEAGCGLFDMGRSQRGSGNEAFKRRWGGEEIGLHYAYVLRDGARVPDFRAGWVVRATRLWRHLPLPAARLLGPLLIRGVP